MDGWIAKSPDFFLSELGDAKLKQEEVDDHLEAEAHGGVRHKPWFFPFSIFVYFSKDFTMWSTEASPAHGGVCHKPGTTFHHRCKGGPSRTGASKILALPEGGHPRLEDNYTGHGKTHC